MQKGRARRRFFIEEPDPHHHGEEVEPFIEKNGHQLPEQRQDIGKDLQALGLVNGRRQKQLYKGNLLEGVENAVDPVSIFQGKGDT